MRITILATTVVFALAGCNAAGTDIPQVADRYQEGIDQAWERASRGEVPTSQCGRVTGTAVGHVSAGNDDGSDAANAYEACYADVHGHWIRQRISQADADQPPCLPLMTGMMTARLSLGSFAGEFGLTLDELDAKLDRSAGAEVDQACPDQAGLILGRKS